MGINFSGLVSLHAKKIIVGPKYSLFICVANERFTLFVHLYPMRSSLNDVLAAHTSIIMLTREVN